MPVLFIFLPIPFGVPVWLWPLAAQGFSIVENTKSNWDLFFLDLNYDSYRILE